MYEIHLQKYRHDTYKRNDRGHQSENLIAAEIKIRSEFSEMSHVLGIGLDGAVVRESFDVTCGNPCGRFAVTGAGDGGSCWSYHPIPPTYPLP